ncbi:uncharacterized protein C8Q71DRAFT_854353 [Rhodofomes roseus]|uniref:Uncharacterized protein n=1 Tax=Rhodofomes roseus TaxID=34475 RepID=A0ABQ8KTS7_9APHY|nr:uncharacterized protein C8Q71DRAFT_854353 [Rhodofomes roseus]KAH9841995.1 hypothetical protein C8Q71DRAFT_854353 [Rhodofomes roseus]
MSHTNKRPRSETSSSADNSALLYLTNKLAQMGQDMFLNPNGDVQNFEDPGGLGLDDDGADLATVMGESTEVRTMASARPQTPQLPDLENDPRLTASAKGRDNTPVQLLHVQAPPQHCDGVQERVYEEDYAFPGDLPQPAFERVDFRAEPQMLDVDTMYPKCTKGIRELLQMVASSYPPADTEDAKRAKHQLVTPYSFYRGLFRPLLLSYVYRQRNGVESAQQFQHSTLFDYSGPKIQKGMTQGWDCIGLYDELEKEHSAILKAQLQDAFFNLVALKSGKKTSAKYNLLKGVPAHLVADVAFAKEQHKQIKLHRLLGQWAYENAIWVPCNRVPADDLKAMEKKFVIESEDILQTALENGAVKRDEAIVPDHSWTRVKKPSPDAGVVSLIFYDSGAQQRGKVCEEDIFGGCIYNSKEFSQIASEISQDAVEIEAESILAFIRAREALRRSFKSVGTMVKSGMGLHSTNSVLHTPLLPVPQTSSANPKEATKTRIAEQTALRVSIQQNKDIIQCYNYAILEGFMPHWARAQMVVAESAQLLNTYGYPNTAAFASFAYGAPSHRDNDDSVTMGWISARSDLIKDDESNFFYADYKLILQMAADTHWMWDAPQTYHGTSLGRLCCANPKSWKTFAKKHAAAGQWSRANVITHTQVTSRGGEGYAAY